MGSGADSVNGSSWIKLRGDWIDSEGGAIRDDRPKLIGTTEDAGNCDFFEGLYLPSKSAILS